MCRAHGDSSVAQRELVGSACYARPMATPRPGDTPPSAQAVDRAMPPSPLRRGDRLGDYVVRGVLGSGGAGRVYRALDTRLKRYVAIKVLATRDRAFTGRFLHEAQSLAALTHPNVVVVHHAGMS